MAAAAAMREIVAEQQAAAMLATRLGCGTHVEAIPRELLQKAAGDSGSAEPLARRRGVRLRATV